MDNIIAIGLGLGLRALIDNVTHHNHRVDGSLVGLWEGAVLHHFISKYPASLDPYVAYGFRLLVDLLWTSSWIRLFIVVLWTFMGILLSDVGVDMASDRRFRRLMRGVRHTVIYPLLRQFTGQTISSGSVVSSSSAAPSSRAQYYQIPASHATSSTARSVPVQSPPLTDVSAPNRPPSSANSGLPRRPALRVPGAFSDRSTETDTDAPPGSSTSTSIRSPREGSVTSGTSSSRATPSVTFSIPLVSQSRPLTRETSRPIRGTTPVAIRSILSPPSSSIPLPPPILSPPILSPPVMPVPMPAPAPLPRASSPELEYISIPAIPDNIERRRPTKPVLSDDERSVGSSLRGHSDRSGLTTPTSDTSRPNNAFSPEPVKSGLTTPANRPSTPVSLPPVRVLDESGRTPSVASRELSDVNPIPIPLRVHERDQDLDDAAQVKAKLLHPELLPDINTPQPSPGLVPPAQFISSAADEKQRMRMPEPRLSSDIGASRLSGTEPPPAYEQTEAGSGENTPAESVISYAGDRQKVIRRAESFRNDADEADKRRTRLKREFETARRERNHWEAFRLKHEMERALQETRELHAKAARRFYHAHNLKPEPQTIDVHRLKVPEAIEKVEQALYDSIVTKTPELRIITGRGNHSKNGIPALKLAIIGAMSDYHIDVSTDPNNSGVLIIHPPTHLDLGAGPSTS